MQLQERNTQISRFLDSLNNSRLSALDKLFTTLVVVSLSMNALPAEKAAAHTEHPQGTEQATGTEPTIITNRDEENAGKLLGSFIEVHSLPPESEDTRFPAIQVDTVDEGLIPDVGINWPLKLPNLGDAIKNLGEAAGLEMPSLLRIEPTVYRNWIERDPQFVDFLKRTGFSVDTARVGMKYRQLKEYVDDGEVQMIEFSFYIWYFFSNGQTEYQVDTQVNITAQPQANETYAVTDADVIVDVPELTFEPVTIEKVTFPNQKAGDIARVTQNDLRFLGNEVATQVSPMIEKQTFVNISNQTDGLPPFATKLFPQNYPGLTQQQVDQLYVADATTAILDIRFGDVVVGADGTQIGLVNGITGGLLTSIKLPEGYFAIQGEITPTVVAANQDGTLIAITGIELQQGNDGITSQENLRSTITTTETTNSALLLRWNTVQGIADFAQSAGISSPLRDSRSVLLETLENGSLERISLLPGEKLVAFNATLVGVRATATGITVRQLAAEAGAGVWSLKNTAQGTKKVEGKYPAQVVEKSFDFTEFALEGISASDIADLQVAVAVAHGIDTNAGDVAVVIQLEGTTASDQRITGQATVVVSIASSVENHELPQGDTTRQGIALDAFTAELKLAQ